MYLFIFSKRHKERLESGQLLINLNSATKQRIIYAMQNFDQRTLHTTETGYNYESSILSDLEYELCSEHGWPCLISHVSESQKMQEAKIADFIRYDEPKYIFDAIEMYSRELGEASPSFQEEINRIFTESRIPWRLSEHVIFQVDSEYMAEVLTSASQLLSAQNFQGVLQEFQEARSDFDSQDYKGCIHHANLALESTMKAILGIEKERPGRLIRKMIDSGIIPSYYDKFLDSFERILRTVNIARIEEKGSGHGQGPKVTQVPRHLAELVLNFCGSLIVFLVNHHIDPQPKEETSIKMPDDDIPF